MYGADRIYAQNKINIQFVCLICRLTLNRIGQDAAEQTVVINHRLGLKVMSFQYRSLIAK